MRNLKRALSLALASVMLLGMMVVGSSAASYPDVDEETHNIEAIDVLQAVEVMVGDEGTGNFRPDDEVSRAEMAVIMAKLLNLDYDYYEALNSPFTDVTGNYDWARGWINACYANGIVSGRGAGIYDPAAGVTAVEAASMMMRALGYFQNSGDYSPNFETSTVRQASQINLFSGVGGNANDALDRNQVAQLALNTLEARMVDFTGDMGFEYEGLSVGYRSEYTYRTGTQSRYDAIEESGEITTVTGTGQAQYYVQLGEQLYNGDLKKDTDWNGFQAPATRWSYKNDEIGLYTYEADYVLEGTVKSSEMYATVGRTVAESYEWSVWLDGSKDNRNDDKAAEPFGKDDVKDNDSDELTGTGNGTYTYVYLLQDPTGASEGLARVCILNTYAAEVSKELDGVITLDDADGQLDVECDEYDVGDVVLYTKYYENDWNFGSFLGLADLVEGEATTVRTDKFVVVDGETYEYNTQFNDLNGSKLVQTYAGQDVALYLDLQGNIVFLGDAEEGTDYALVIGVGESAQYNTNNPVYGAQLILADGTYKNVILDKDLTDGIIKDAKEAEPAVAAEGDDAAVDEREQNLEYVRDRLLWKAFAWTENNDGTFELSDMVGNEERTVDSYGAEFKSEDIWSKTKVVAGVPVSVDNVLSNGKANTNLGEFFEGLGTIKFDEDTIFVLNDVSDSDRDFSVYIGYKNVPDVKLTTASTVSTYKNANGVARVVFITDAVVESAKTVVVIIGDGNPRLEKSGKVTYWNYKAVVDGEVTTVKVKQDSDAEDSVADIADKMPGFFAGVTFDDSGYVTKLKDIADTDKMKVNGERYGVDVKYYLGTKTEKKGVYGFAYDEGTKEYKESFASNEDVLIIYFGEYKGSNNTLHLENSVTNDKNDEAWVVTDDGDVVAIFVKSIKDGATNDTQPNDPGTGDPGTGDPGTGDPGTGDPGTGDPGTGDPSESAGKVTITGDAEGKATISGTPTVTTRGSTGRTTATFSLKVADWAAPTATKASETKVYIGIDYDVYVGETYWDSGKLVYAGSTYATPAENILTVTDAEGAATTTQGEISVVTAPTFDAIASADVGDAKDQIISDGVTIKITNITYDEVRVRFQDDEGNDLVLGSATEQFLTTDKGTGGTITMLNVVDGNKYSDLSSAKYTVDGAVNKADDTALAENTFDNTATYDPGSTDIYALGTGWVTVKISGLSSDATKTDATTAANGTTGLGLFEDTATVTIGNILEDQGETDALLTALDDTFKLVITGYTASEGAITGDDTSGQLYSALTIGNQYAIKADITQKNTNTKEDAALVKGYDITVTVKGAKEGTITLTDTVAIGTATSKESTIFTVEGPITAEVTIVPKKAPVLTGATFTASTGELVLTFSDSIDASSVAKAAFDLTAGDGNTGTLDWSDLVSPVLKRSDDGKTITLYLSGAAADGDKIELVSPAGLTSGGIDVSDSYYVVFSGAGAAATADIAND